MKKHFMAALVAIILCLAMLTGCSVVKVFEKDLQIVLNVNGEVQGVYTVNIFSNAVVSEPEAPEGMSFYGWTPQENWAELEQDEVVVVPNKTFIKYNDVKDFVRGEELSVTLYAAFYVIPPKDLVVAWYRAEGVSTATGLDQNIMDTFTENMYTFLETKDYTPSEMDIVVRPYDGNVGTSCGRVLEDGDVDIMVGWAANINSNGGITYKQNESGVEIGTISRYAARLNDKYLTRLVYVWILNTYGGQNLDYPSPDDIIPEEPEEPETPEEPGETELPSYTVPDEQFSIKIAWYDNSNSGITAENMTAFEDALKAALVQMGFNLDKLTVTVKGYSGKVGEACEAIKADGDVDIMVGWSTTSNLTGTGGLVEGTDFLENVGGVVIGSTSRYAARVTDSNLTNIVYAWIQNIYGAGGAEYPAVYGWEPSAPETPETPEEPEEPTYEYEVVIAWYRAANQSTNTGLTDENMETFKTALAAFLEEKGYTADGTNIILRAYDDGVADTCGAIMAAGDVDIMVGWAGNIGTTGKMEEGKDFLENQSGVSIGTVSRSAARLNDEYLTRLVYTWILNTYGGAELEYPEPPVTEEPAPEPDTSEKVKLVIGWWSYKTSGLTQEIMNNFEAALKEYLVSEGYNLDNVELIFREYSQSGVADMGAAMNEDGDLDVIIGIGTNITSTGKVDVVEKQGEIPMGGTTRFVALRVETVIGRLVYEWVKTEAGYSSLAAIA